MMKHNLKYHFVAIYKDGTYYTQTSDDVSVKGEEFGSSFSDVNQENLSKFVLVESQNNYWAVDLATKTFSHNGVPFFVGEELPHGSSKTRLVYVRRNYVFLSQDGNRDKRVTYLLGWETSDDRGIIQLT